ncbi:MAG: glutathione S-transferase [Gaiellales bacterium]|nr:glutathione S-transferase [Gaiellales bacterium]
MLALYDHPISSNALKVRFLLAELGLEYERRPVPIERPRPEWYAAINPLLGIPTLQDGELILSESNAILRYLANRERRDDLYPADPAARARVDMMLDRYSLTLRPALFQVEAAALGFSPEGGFGSVPGDPAAARARMESIAPTLRTFDGVVSEAGYWLGDFTLVDCAAAPALYRTTLTGLDLTPFPNLMRVRDAIIARPAFGRADPAG